MRLIAFLMVSVFLLTGCGVPAGAGRLAAREVVVMGGVDWGDEAGVRRALQGQAVAWGELSFLMGQRVIGGVPVEREFVELVEQTAAVARRQRELMGAGEDDAELNRAVLEKLRGMWGKVREYLGEGN